MPRCVIDLPFSLRYLLEAGDTAVYPGLAGQRFVRLARNSSRRPAQALRHPIPGDSLLILMGNVMYLRLWPVLGPPGSLRCLYLAAPLAFLPATFVDAEPDSTSEKAPHTLIICCIEDDCFGEVTVADCEALIRDAVAEENARAPQLTESDDPLAKQPSDEEHSNSFGEPEFRPLALMPEASVVIVGDCVEIEFFRSDAPIVGVWFDCLADVVSHGTWLVDSPRLLIQAVQIDDTFFRGPTEGEWLTVLPAPGAELSGKSIIPFAQPLGAELL